MTRYWFKEHVESEMIESRFYSLIEVINESPLYMLFCARMSPVIPGSLNNLLFGLTTVTNFKYLVGSAIGICPQLFLFVYIGSCLDNLTNISEKGHASKEKLILMCVGVLLTLIMVIYLMKKTSDQIKKKSIERSTDMYRIDQL